MFKIYKNKKGISLIILIITIIVLLILISTVIMSFTELSNNTKKKQFAKEIYTIQTLVDKYNFENNNYPYVKVAEDNKSVTVSVNDANMSQFQDETIINNTVTLYELNLTEVGVESLSRGYVKDGNTNDVYSFSKDTGKVYYVKGYKVGKDTYYTLTDELEKQIGVKNK